MCQQRNSFRAPFEATKSGWEIVVYPTTSPFKRLSFAESMALPKSESTDSSMSMFFGIEHGFGTTGTTRNGPYSHETSSISRGLHN